jgi:hypothetical protein
MFACKNNECYRKVPISYVKCQDDKKCEDQNVGPAFCNDKNKCEKRTGGSTSYAGDYMGDTQAEETTMDCVRGCLEHEDCNSWLCPAPPSSSVLMGCVKRCLSDDDASVPLFQTKTGETGETGKEIKYYMCAETGEIVRSV